MSMQDKVSGRLKKAAGDLTGDEKLHDQGVREERKAEAKRELHEAQQRAEDLREEVARLEYGGGSEAASPQTSRDESEPDEQARHVQTHARGSDDDAVDTPRGSRR